MVRALGTVLDLERDRVVVIDDNSPDGTGRFADELAAELPWLSVVHRPFKEGLGRAYLAGFQQALAFDPTFVLEVDCDFSHDPSDVPRLIAACDAGSDLALGSRYVAGGGTANWSRVRRWISISGSFYARAVLGVDIRDLTGGFKCFRRRVLETIDLESVATRGYAFQIEMTYRTLLAGFIVTEVPITFVERQVGTSKINFRIVAEAVWKVPALRFKHAVGRL